ncbi:MAG: UDP-glucose--lipooligosaccharide beta 1-4 glucosyltransferase [Pseudomonadota bacterium]|jgi:glycosyltransferase involved in cell wall biosynthesis|uniref:Glycosyltransferase n=1 Tax=Thiothrix fructosivorans TaxID=111770 RepID=A0A8B0SJZ8_9GAMM|nr:glycosyltransferase [Thiothrix fructosivorans]MBO0611936.1 glycosyltransferase [Thiothrix fructosivorans]QTX12553.1 glycosyltransferase [Thiothrix fructosivorans]
MQTQINSVCWNAIVKNESHIIERCMASMVKELDYWVVVDTGSTDGTQDIIRNFMAQHGIPGELIERPWVNFSHNRSEALQLAEHKADYILFCDADMALEVQDPDWKQHLSADAYLVDQHAHGGLLVYPNIRLVNGRLEGDRRFRYWGATHEYCDSIEPLLAHRSRLNGISMLDFADGGAKSDKYARDAHLLQNQITQLEALETASPAVRQTAYDSGILRHAPNLITRSTFYLAKTYRDNDQSELAIATYQKRVTQGGWKEEVWYALFEIARLKENLHYPEEDIIRAYLDAHENRPSRAEALHHLARYLRRRERYALAYTYALTANATPLTDDILFVMRPVYDWQAQDELAIAAYWIGRYQQCAELCEQLLTGDVPLPDSARERIQANWQYANAKQQPS